MVVEIEWFPDLRGDSRAGEIWMRVMGKCQKKPRRKAGLEFLLVFVALPVSDQLVIQVIVVAGVGVPPLGVGAATVTVLLTTVGVAVIGKADG